MPSFYCVTYIERIERMSSPDIENYKQVAIDKDVMEWKLDTEYTKSTEDCRYSILILNVIQMSAAQYFTHIALHNKNQGLPKEESKS